MKTVPEISNDHPGDPVHNKAGSFCEPRSDERNTIFSRMELVENSDAYNEYYSMHPERKEIDDFFREAREQREDDIHIRRQVDSTFDLLKDMRQFARGEAAEQQITISPSEATAYLQQLAQSYGAVVFGTALLGESCFYKIRGRGNEYGKGVNIDKRQGIVFGVHMNLQQIRQAPKPEASAEVVNGYARVALAGLALSYCIRSWGWKADCTMDGRADVILPIAARYAGLGSIGRSGLLLTKEYGPCIRLGAVLTDLPLERTKRNECNESRVCAACRKCAEACPGKALDMNYHENGQFHPVNDNECFKKWLEFGTDCGLCIAQCPLSR
jgi:NAD-dependent dihydropyrimidine dehydrogenase PreA subunit